ncbi:hypothetical protein AAHC03_023060 [Spirometra sp. Aus1]
MRTVIPWSFPPELNILLILLIRCISAAPGSSVLQRMSAVNCQLVGDSLCSKLYGNSFCDRRKNECRCAADYVLISDGNDNMACNEVVSDEVCERDNECRQIRRSICHPGVGQCTCPFDFHFNRSAKACLADSKSLMITSRAEQKRAAELPISSGSLQHGLIVCIVTSLIASSVFCCLVFAAFLIYRRCSSTCAGLDALRQARSCNNNNNGISSSPALLTSLLTPCYLDLRPVEANNPMIFRGLEIKNDFNQDVTQKTDEEARIGIETQII